MTTITIDVDVAQLSVDLKLAAQVLNDRCLKHSAKFVSELWIGLPLLPPPSSNAAHRHDDDITSSIPPSYQTLLHQHSNAASFYPEAQVMYAKSLMDLGEYAAAAAALSQPPSSSSSFTSHRGGSGSSGGIVSMAPPLPHLNAAATSLRAYALYLAGARRQQEQALEFHSSNATSSTSSEAAAAATGASSSSTTPVSHHHYSHFLHDMSVPHPYAAQLWRELSEFAQTQQLDAFGYHVLGMLLMQPPPEATIVRDDDDAMVLPTHALPALVQSVLAFPYNWSAWLDLHKAWLQGQDERPTTTPSSSSTKYDASWLHRELLPLKGHLMYHLYCAHAATESGNGSDHGATNAKSSLTDMDFEQALEIYERWSAVFAHSPYLTQQIGIVQYHMRELTGAQQALASVQHHFPYRLDALDVLSNILYVQQDVINLSTLAHQATHVDKYRPETCCIVGNYYSLRQNRAKAIQNFARALQIDPSCVSAWTLLGHEYIEWKQAPQALECYRQAVQVAPHDYRAWYGLGQAYEFLNMSFYALYYYKKACTLRRYDARMWCALGATYLSLDRPDDALRAYERAHQLDDWEGVATLKLAKLYEKKKHWEKAATCYMKHLELRYHATTTTTQSANSSDMQITLEKILQELVVEAPEAEALLYLANYHKNVAQYDAAALFAQRLLDYPGSNEREQAHGLVRELRSRKTVNKKSTKAYTRGPTGGGNQGGGDKRENDARFAFSP